MSGLDHCVVCNRQVNLGNTGAFNVEKNFALCMNCLLTTRWNNRESLEDVLHKAAQWDEYWKTQEEVDPLPA